MSGRRGGALAHNAHGATRDMSEDLKTLWTRIVERVKNELESGHADQLIEGARPIQLDAGRLTVLFETGWARDWVEARHLSDLKDIIQDFIPGINDLQLISKADEKTGARSPANPMQNRVKDDETKGRTRKNGSKKTSTTSYVAPTTSPTQNGSGDRENTPIGSLNPRYTFDSFVVGPSNRFAQAASLAVAEEPAGTYNPLFLYGGVGLGKTHLMQAISHYVRVNHPRMVVVYVSSETFTNDLINALQRRSMPEFRQKYREIDVLLVDDIQFVAGKESTQEEFFHTFNTLYEAEKQIIISSDRPPKEIPTLQERLRSRFEWGLTTDIQQPDLETRVAILQNKAALEGINLPNETCLYIAETIESNIRELEGALVQVVAYANIQNCRITPEIAETALRDIVSHRKSRVITIDAIQQIVATHYGINIADMKSKKRTRAIAFPRQIAMYLSREMTDASLPRIGEQFGGRDHSTVIHACDKIRTSTETDRSLSQILHELEQKIKNPQ